MGWIGVQWALYQGTQVLVVGGWLMEEHISPSGHIDGLVQEKRNSSMLAMELRLSYINLSTWRKNKVINTSKRRCDVVLTL